MDKVKKYNSQYEKMTQAPVSELVVSLGIPTTISMLITSVYNLADTFFVSKLGNSASGAVGIVFSFMAILQAFGFMYGQGAGSNISRFLGAKNEEKASIYASTGFISAIVTGVLIYLVCMINLENMVFLLGSTETIYPYAKDYLLYMSWAAPFVMGGFVLNNILRFEGKAKLSMIGLMSGGILNMLLDPLLIFGFDLGVKGAALATGISQTVSFSILLSMFLRKKTQSKLKLSNVSHNLWDYWNICATGFPSLIRQGMGSIANMALNWQVKIYGDAAVAAMSIVSRVGMLIFSSGLGIGQGFQPVCGFNYGAKKYSRVKAAYLFTLKAATIVMGVVSLTCFIFASPIIGLFRDDADVIRIGALALRAQCLSLIIIPIMVTSNMTLQSTGQKALASFTAILRSGIYFIPSLFILSSLMGLTGIQIAQAIADAFAVMTCVPIIVRFLNKMPEDGI